MVKGKAKPKSPSEYKTVGKPGTRRRDVAPKVLGTLEYIVDVKVPGMLHGRMIRPPVAGAVPTAVDEASVKDIPGVKVVWREGLHRRGRAEGMGRDPRRREKLKVTWSDVKPPFPGNAGLYDHIRNAKVVKYDKEEKVGDVDAAFANAAKVVEAIYEWPFQSHAGMAPACGVADVRDGEATVWTGSQKAHYCARRRRQDAQAAGGEGDGHPDDRPRLLRPQRFRRRRDGRRRAVEGGRQAGARAGHALRRHRLGPEGPGLGPHRARRDRQGRQGDGLAVRDQGVLQARHAQQRRLAGAHARRPAAGLAAEAGVPVRPSGRDPTASTPMHKISGTIPPLLDRASPLRTAHLRDPGGPQTHFAVESFMDEVALATGMDPVEFRLRYLSKRARHRGDQGGGREGRLAAARRRAQAGEGRRVRRPGHRLCGARRHRASRSSPRSRSTAPPARSGPRKFTVAHDCGQIIAPDLLRLTIEGNIVQTHQPRALGRGEVRRQERHQSIDWKSYPIVDMTDAPETIDIILIDHPEIAPTGAGEGSTRPTAAAIANAIFDATGIRLRQAPFTPERLKAGMA